MDNVLKNGFFEMTLEEKEFILGGGWAEFGWAVGGSVVIAVSPVVGVVAGIGGSVVGTPLVGVGLGVAAGTGTASMGANMLDRACKK